MEMHLPLQDYPIYIRAQNLPDITDFQSDITAQLSKNIEYFGHQAIHYWGQ